MESLALRALRALLDKLHSRRPIFRLALSSETQILISEEGEAGASQAPPTPAAVAAAEEEEDMEVLVQVREWHAQTLMILQVLSETHHQTVVVAMIEPILSIFSLLKLIYRYDMTPFRGHKGMRSKYSKYSPGALPRAVAGPYCAL